MTQTLEGHTVRRYDGELNAIHMRVLEMGGLVQEQVRQALQALLNKDVKAAEAVLDREHSVDKLELKADDDVMTVIARRGPVARDLRVVIAFLKAITDLERIGDEAARIGYLTTEIYGNGRADPATSLLRDIQTMGNFAKGMLKDALEAFDNLDSALAEKIVTDQRDLDAEFQSSLRRLTTFVLEDARNVGHTIQVVLVIKALERIGEHARNLAEYVIYLVRGDDVRHRYSSNNSNS